MLDHHADHPDTNHDSDDHDGNLLDLELEDCHRNPATPRSESKTRSRRWKKSYRPSIYEARLENSESACEALGYR